MGKPPAHQPTSPPIPESPMKLEDLNKASKVKELMRLSGEALDRGDELLALKYYRQAKMLNY
jgi:hypothetical protein